MPHDHTITRMHMHTYVILVHYNVYNLHVERELAHSAKLGLTPKLAHLKC